MIYGFVDESGAPGVATKENDFLVVGLVLFDGIDAVKDATQKMKQLRCDLGVVPSYEFHCSHNARVVQKEVLKLIERLDFCYFVVAIRKNRIKKYASYTEIAKLFVHELETLGVEEIRINMDSNPVLYYALRSQLKNAIVPYCRVKEVESRKCDLVQIADYIVNLSAKQIAGHNIKLPRALLQNKLTLIIKN